MLADALNSPVREIRIDAVKALANIPDRRAAEPLITALGATDKATRQAAVQALSQRKDPRAFGPLIQALRDPDMWVHKQAVPALDGYRDPRAFQPMLAAERDPKNEAARSWFRMVMGVTLDPRDMKALAAALQSGDPIAATDTLSWMGKRGVPLLIGALHSGNPETRKRAARVLSKSNDRRVAKALLQPSGNRTMRRLQGHISSSSSAERPATMVRSRRRPGLCSFSQLCVSACPESLVRPTGNIPSERHPEIRRSPKLSRGRLSASFRLRLVPRTIPISFRGAMTKGHNTSVTYQNNLSLHIIRRCTITPLERLSHVTVHSHIAGGATAPVGEQKEANESV